MVRATAGPAAQRVTTPGTGGERGSATVEAALALCALVVVVALALAGVTAMVAQVRCIDAAREAARLVARGEPERAEQAAREVAPRDAQVAVRISADEVTVVVSAEPVGAILPMLTVRGEALAVLEPGVAGGR